MMGFKERAFAPLVTVSLEELVPQDHFYRHLQRVLDLSFPLWLVLLLSILSSFEERSTSRVVSVSVSLCWLRQVVHVVDRWRNTTTAKDKDIKELNG